MELTERVTFFESKIVMLKSYLFHEVKVLKSYYHVVKPQKSDIIISGIPARIKDSPHRILHRVFSTLHMPDLLKEIPR